MGCTQSNMISYAEITDEDRKLIPTLFREISSAHHSRGVSYWLASSFVKEGTVPFKIGDETYTAEYVCVTKKGYDPEELDKPCQDSYLFSESTFIINGKEERGLFAGVFDGHGAFGKECSILCRDYIEKCITSHSSVSSVESFISDSLKKCNDNMHEQRFSCGPDDTYSGTTAVCISLVNGVLSCINIGDSRCVAGFVAPDDQVIPIPLSRDQTPSRPDEKERLERCGAEISTLRQRRNSNDQLVQSGEVDVSLSDPPRIYIPHKSFPGAAFSRSIGDYMAETVGVIAESEIESKKAVSGLNHVILGSDGLWSYYTQEEVACAVKYSTDLGKTAVSIVMNGFLRWMNSCGGSDDITMVVIRFPSLPKDEAGEADWKPSEHLKKNTMIFTNK